MADFDENGHLTYDPDELQEMIQFNVGGNNIVTFYEDRIEFSGTLKDQPDEMAKLFIAAVDKHWGEYLRRERKHD